jgi:thiamine biosynthesis lipoprotein
MMGTYVHISTFHRHDDFIKKNIEKAFDAIGNVENIMSIYKEDSEVSKLNTAQKPGRYPVSDEMWYLLTVSDEIHKLSEGAFDITVKPLMDMWTQAVKEDTLPTDTQIRDTMAKVGWDKIVLHPATKEIEFTVEGMELTLSGIAKGYAIDRAVAVFRKAGVSNCLVDAGGDVYCYGKPDKRDFWNIGVRDPIKNTRIIKVLNLKDVSVVTSGNYARYYKIKDKEFSQIFSPKTGEPVKVNTSVTVISDSATRADAWATALMALDPEEGVRVVEKNDNLEALILSTLRGKLDIRKSSGFENYERKNVSRR